MKYLLPAPLLACLGFMPAPETPPVAGQAAPAEQAVTDHKACSYFPAIFLDPAIARQGADLTIRILEPPGPFGSRPIPRELLTGWKAVPDGEVSLSHDGATLSVLPSATPGATVEISASFCGRREISRTLRIVGKDEPVLTGLWREQGKQCEGETPGDIVRELEFRDTGYFSVTYTPFEAYRDFWGQFAFNPSDGQLTMTITGGNKVPSQARLSGKATLRPDGALVLEQVFLSEPRTVGGVCTYTFGK